MSLTDSCYHCNEPLPRQNPQQFSATIHQIPQYFCCPACRTVAETIHHLGLEQYYSQRDQKPQKPAIDPENFADMDIPEIRQTFVHQRSDNSYEAQLFIPDIHCASCCWLIEKCIEGIVCVDDAQTQLNNHKLTLRWHGDDLRVSDIFSALANIGYRALPWQPVQQQEHARSQQKQLLQRLGVAGILAMQIHMIAMGAYFGAQNGMQQWLNGVALLLSLPIWFYCADPFLSGAWRNVKAIVRMVMRHDYAPGGDSALLTASMDLPVALAIVAAAIASIIAVIKGSNDVYFDSVAMFVFLLLAARYLEAQARSKLASYSQEPVLPHTCTRILNGTMQRIAVENLQPLDQVMIDSGIIPVDGIVLSGTAEIEQAAMTGEFLPVHKTQGDQVMAGTRLLSGELLVQAQQWGADSHIAQLHKRMENTLSRKNNFYGYNFYSHIAQFFTPTVLLIAFASALYWQWADPAKALPAFLAVLVASCPCALSLAIPAAFTAATLQLRRCGILVTGNHVLQLLPNIKNVAFDKTGTLTQGRMSILSVKLFSTETEQQCCEIACAMERSSTHPVASAFLKYQQENAINYLNIDVVIAVLHCGMEATLDGDIYRLGKPQWSCIDTSLSDTLADDVTLTKNGKPIAQFSLGDPLRSDAQHCLQQLQAIKVHCSIISGDHSNSVDSIARTLAITDVHKACSPEQKVRIIDSIKRERGTVAMIGDGINDGPVLAHADISIALAEASQTAQLAADVILLNNRLGDLITLRHVALRTRAIARQNLSWALLYNLSILPMAAAGLLPPVTAALGMALSSLLVTANALRLFRNPKRALPA